MTTFRPKPATGTDEVIVKNTVGEMWAIAATMAQEILEDVVKASSGAREYIKKMGLIDDKYLSTIENLPVGVAYVARAIEIILNMSTRNVEKIREKVLSSVVQRKDNDNDDINSWNEWAKARLLFLLYELHLGAICALTVTTVIRSNNLSPDPKPDLDFDIKSEKNNGDYLLSLKIVYYGDKDRYSLLAPALKAVLQHTFGLETVVVFGGEKKEEDSNG